MKLRNVAKKYGPKLKVFGARAVMVGSLALVPALSFADAITIDTTDMLLDIAAGVAAGLAVSAAMTAAIISMRASKLPRKGA